MPQAAFFRKQTKGTKTMKKSIIAALFTATAIATSCGGGKTKSQVLAFDSVKYENKVKNIEIAIKADFPKQGDGAVVNAIREYISETLGGTYSGDLAAADSMIAFYGKAQADSLVKMTEDFDGVEPPMTSRYEIKKVYESERLVTMTTYTEEYLGGAHGMSTESGVTFRKSDGRRFGQDMLRNTDSEEFHQLIRNGLKDYFNQFEEAKVSTDEQLKEMLLVDDDVNYLPLPQFPPYMTANGIVFTYQPYEIAPYAAGMPQFTVPYDKIEKFLTATTQKIITHN